MAEVLVELEQVTKEYGTTARTLALRGVSLRLEEGSFAALIGGSGSGKSTLLNILGALDRPTSGAVRIAGRELGRMSDDELADLRNTSLGFVFQFHYLLPEFSVLENVLMPRLIRRGRIDAAARRRALELLEMVGMVERQHQRANAISGGEQQRAAIARALVNDPRLVLADEPTGNLDSQNSEAVFRLLRSVNRELGTAFLIVTHDRHLASRADRLLELADGRLVADRDIRGRSEMELWPELAPPQCLMFRQGGPGCSPGVPGAGQGQAGATGG